MLSNTQPTYVGAKRRTGPVDFHVNKMRAPFLCNIGRQSGGYHW